MKRSRPESLIPASSVARGCGHRWPLAFGSFLVRGVLASLVFSTAVLCTAQPNPDVLRQQCETGEAAACRELGLMHAGGRGVNEDAAAAAQLFGQACDGGDASGCLYLLVLYELGAEGVLPSSVRAAAAGEKAEAAGCGLVASCIEAFRQDCRAGYALACSLVGGSTSDDAEAVELFERACESGDAVGCVLLAVEHERGVAAPRDVRHAAELYRRACDRGHPGACFRLAVMSEMAGSPGQDPEPIIALYERACDRGHVEACDLFGFMYEVGRGVPQDEARAAAIYRRSCDRGVVEKCSKLGTMYEAGSGVPQDAARAADLYRGACDRRNHTACVRIGVLYEEGRGVAPDPTRAADSYQRACDGDPGTCVELAERYAEPGERRDLARAAAFYKQACEAGEKSGCFGLLSVAMDLEQGRDGIAEDVVRAAVLYGQACDGGQHFSCERLADLTEKGSGVPRDAARAAALYRRACEGQIASACSRLGLLTEAGAGVPLDLTDAAELHWQACEGEDALGCARLAFMHQNGMGVPADSGRASALFERVCGDDARDCKFLASDYANGLNVSKDEGFAAFLFEALCDRGDADSCSSIGALYAEGTAVPLDLARAAGFRQRGCEGGNGAACGLLAFQYWRGKGVPKDPARAVELALEACDDDFCLPCIRLGIDLRFGSEEAPDPDPARAAQLLERACSAGPAFSCELVGHLYEVGLGVDKDLARATGLYEKGCEGGAPLGCVRLGGLYEDAEGVGQDLARATDLYEKGCEGGEMYGCRRLGMVYEKGLAGPANPARAVELFEQGCGGGDAISCELLGDMDDGAGAKALLTILKHEDESVRAAAAEALETAPADEVRAPLQRLLKDPVRQVRVLAGASLLSTQSDVPDGALAAVVEGVCSTEDHVAGRLRGVLVGRRELSLSAAEMLVGYLRGDDSTCHPWAAVTLGEFVPWRAGPALGLIREALASESKPLYSAAAAAIHAMGPAARSARGDLEDAARGRSELTRFVEGIETGPTRLLDSRIEDLRLVAVLEKDGQRRAYLLHDHGPLWEAQAGDPFANGEIEELEAEALTFSARRVAEDYSLVPYQGRMAMFEHTQPEPLPAGAPSEQYPASVDFEGDVRSFAKLLGEAFGVNFVVEADTHGPVRIAARNQPWDGIRDVAFKTAGFDYLVDRKYVRVARRDRIEKIRPLRVSPSGQPVNLSFVDADLRLIALLFADISGRQVELPPDPAPQLVTLNVIEAPWEEALDLIVASRGWSMTIEDERILVEKPALEH